MAMVNTLIHLHTDYSFDSNITLESLAAFATSEGFGCIAVTDHDTIEGALRLRSLTDIRVVVGEEVSTREGHLIGLFLEQRIRPGMSARDTARAIREQGGLVFVPHPFVRGLGCGLGAVAAQIADVVDAVEVCNGQNFFPYADRRARRFARRLGLAEYVGADSHSLTSIGPCHQLMRDFRDAPDFLDALKTAELKPGYHSVGYFLNAVYRTARYLTSHSLPPGYGANAHAGEGERSGLGVPVMPRA